jgi:hypothetical protein
MTLDEEFSQDLAELGVETNKKDVRARQSSKFLGIVFDTRTMTFRVERDVTALFGERCSDMLRAGSATPRDMARLVGLLNWWSIACWGAKLMSRSIQFKICRISTCRSEKENFFIFIFGRRTTSNVSGVQLAQPNRGLFHFRRAAFSATLKAKVGSTLAKAAALRVNLNVDGVPITSKTHTHPSHSQTSRYANTYIVA